MPFRSPKGEGWEPKTGIGISVLDKEMVLRYHGTMNTVATNLRFPADEYREIKLLALSEGKSTAALIRHAVSLYKDRKLTGSVQIKMAEKFRKSAVKINIPVLELISEGRKFG